MISATWSASLVLRATTSMTGLMVGRPSSVSPLGRDGVFVVNRHQAVEQFGGQVVLVVLAPHDHRRLYVPLGDSSASS